MLGVRGLDLGGGACIGVISEWVGVCSGRVDTHLIFVD